MNKTKRWAVLIVSVVGLLLAGIVGETIRARAAAIEIAQAELEPGLKAVYDKTDLKFLSGTPRWEVFFTCPETTDNSPIGVCAVIPWSDTWGSRNSQD